MTARPLRAHEPAAVPEAVAPNPARGPLTYLGLDGGDLLALGALVAVAFLMRFFSPLMPDFFAHPLDGAPVTDCVQHTPISADGRSGTLCGLAYPFQRGSLRSAGAGYDPPNGQVFDEVYFGVDAHNDLKGIGYFDPEPPLAKELIAAGEWGYGWWRATFEGAQGGYADLGFNAFGWRIMSCIFGTLCVPMMYLFARALWPNRTFALAAAVLTNFDGMFFTQSRIGMIDIFPIFFLLLAYWVFAIHLRSRGPVDSMVTLLLLGVAIGLAVSSKWITLAAWGTMIFFLVARALRRGIDFEIRGKSGTWSWDRGEGPALPGGAPVATYVGVALLAFVLIPLLIYIASWEPFFARQQFHNLNDLWLYQVQSFQYHATLTEGHPWGSKWFSWPFDWRPVAYYYQWNDLGVDQASGRNLVAGWTDLGNPWIWWTSLPCLVALPYFVLRHRSFPAALILVGFLTQWLPFSRVTRVLFMYHMFGGLIFMILALAFVLAWIAQGGADVRLGAHRAGLPGRNLLVAHLGVAVIAFCFFYPVWTALPITDNAYLGTFPWGKIWLPTWI